MHRNFQPRCWARRLTFLAAAAAAFVTARNANAADLMWKGYTWAVTNGGMAGVANGSAANVSVDADGYLHLKIQKNGSTWTAAELFTTAKLGFGTYQWQIDGPIDTLDKNVVLGLFPYGPAAGIGDDGTNEIDIEYSRWGQSNGPNGDWTDYPASGSTVGEFTYTFSLNGGTLSTSRFIWTKTSIEDFLLAGLQPITSTAQLLKTWKYAPSNPTTNIPQQALPLGINLWCFDIPSDGKNVEIVIRDFQFVAEGSSPMEGGGGTPGHGGSSSGGRANSAGGANPNGGATGAAGGINPNGGANPNGGTTSLGGRSTNGGASSGGNSSGGATASGGAFTTGGVSSTGATANGGSPTSGGSTFGGARDSGEAFADGGSTASGGSFSSGGAQSSGGQRAHASGGANSIPGESASCSVRVANGAPRGLPLSCLGAAALLIARRIRRRVPHGVNRPDAARASPH